MPTKSTDTAVAWQEILGSGIRAMLSTQEMQACVPIGHRKDTPTRVVKAFADAFWGVCVDPASVLKTHFEEEVYSEMIHVEAIDFTSYCMHHLLPFTGKVHFAYVPDKRIVGLSKIPRMIEVLAARPQVQEALTHQIGKVFQDVVVPKGCAVMLYDVTHACTAIRGVKKAHAKMRTTAFFGCFSCGESRSEFLSVSNGRS
jgi:GTP cyclohydrolase IA